MPIDHFVQVLLNLVLIPPQKGPHEEIFQHRHLGKNLSSLGHHGNTQGIYLVRRQFIDTLTAKADFSRRGVFQTADGA